ncbi:response regulator transcription factor [Limnohabitans sp.]|uniref:response regulator transcription factor n=1 Tax=Limnohabitans sp. TaxID=1907725 RepID=UPI002FDE3524
MNILLVEDEQHIADFIMSGFRAEGFAVHHDADGFRGLNTALIKKFDAIVLDVSMPLLDGFEVLGEIRRKGLKTPVMMLTARTELIDRLKGFEKGADDYLAKPFFIEELVVRVKTLIARQTGSAQPTITQSGVTLNRFSRVAQWGKQTALLTQREFVLLESFLLSPGQIFTRQQILKQVWNVDFDPGTNVVDVCIQRLRRKLDDSSPDALRAFPLETIRGVGYRLNNV